MDINEIINKSKQFVYYYYRKVFNTTEDIFKKSVLLLFLNKTGFRGLYREGPNGFNVPYGHYKKTPTIITETDLYYISDLIKDVEFIHSDFNESIKNAKEGDFV